LLAAAFFNFQPTSINPSSSLATHSIDDLRPDNDSGDLDSSSWPHFNKIMSENLAPLQPNLLPFEKSHSQTEHPVGVFDLSTPLFT
jgi:hypothetical protein